MDIEEIKSMGSAAYDMVNKLDRFLPVMRQIAKSLDSIHALMLAQQKQEENEYHIKLNHLLNHLVGDPENIVYEAELDVIRQMIEKKELPSAIDPIYLTPKDPVEKADSILSLIVNESFNEKRFLDFGCGDGATINLAKKKGAYYACGYDPNPKFKKEGLVNNLMELEGTFDIILAYDVIDHSSTPLDDLKAMYKLLSPSGKIYLCTHPWSSRNGAHIQNQQNTAFLHLILDDIELQRLTGSHPETIQRVIYPMKTYREWIEQAGLEIIKELPYKEIVETIFTEPGPISKRISRHWQTEDDFQSILGISAVEYILTAKKDFRNNLF